MFDYYYGIKIGALSEVEWLADFAKVNGFKNTECIRNHYGSMSCGIWLGKRDNLFEWWVTHSSSNLANYSERVFTFYEFKKHSEEISEEIKERRKKMEKEKVYVIVENDTGKADGLYTKEELLRNFSTFDSKHTVRNVVTGESFVGVKSLKALNTKKKKGE